MLLFGGIVIIIYYIPIAGNLDLIFRISLIYMSLYPAVNKVRLSMNFTLIGPTYSPLPYKYILNLLSFILSTYLNHSSIHFSIFVNKSLLKNFALKCFHIGYLAYTHIFVKAKRDRNNIMKYH